MFIYDCSLVSWPSVFPSSFPRNKNKKAAHVCLLTSCAHATKNMAHQIASFFCADLASSPSSSSSSFFSS